jgi:U32 family peptidase
MKNIQKKHKAHIPELLAPVGSIEAFHAAVTAGADAIYLGLNAFNARNKAKNFTPKQLAAVVKMARSKGIKSYVTLNIVVRNGEINQLLDTLWILQQIKPDAIIIQDIGVLYLIKRFFPTLSVHASTQMGIHNSDGVNYAHAQGIERVVLAREITNTELEQIARKSKAELELFVHGALCYSLSGMCLFSSYLGGASANRGICSQPCRRVYTQNKTDNYFFSLKDNQLIEHLPFLSKLNISSLKIEGRIKSADYVFQTTSAYRLALDSFQQTEQAKALLKNDFGREKTAYFLGHDVAQAITQQASTGLIIGHVLHVEKGQIAFRSDKKLPKTCRLRFRNAKTDEQFSISVSNLDYSERVYSFKTDNQEIKQGYEVYQAGQNTNFSSQISCEGIKINTQYPASLAQKVQAALNSKKTGGTQQLFIRIDNLKWLELLPNNAGTEIILALSYKDLQKLTNSNELQKLKRPRMHVELPQFISEKSINKYKKLLDPLFAFGFQSFVLNQLYQKGWFPAHIRTMASENIYTFNDAAIQQLRSEKIVDFIYPLENDIVNLGKTSNRSGIVPLFFYPKLFYSRMPIEAEKEDSFADKMGQKFRKTIKEGLTIVLPEKAVSLTQYKTKLERYGYNRFLIDLSFVTPSIELYQDVVTAFSAGKSVSFPSSGFNFKRELK